MSVFPWGTLISAGGSLLGGLLGRDSASEAAANQTNLTREMIAQQKNFAQNGIRWRVDDAKLAGIHPLAALGANTVSFSPVSVGGTADMSMANAVSSMGQDIGRAVNATRTAPERDQAYRTAAAEIALAKGEAEVNLLKAQTASTLKQSVGSPAFPGSRYMLDGQGNTPFLEKSKPVPMVDLKGNERYVVDPARPYQEPVSRSDRSYLTTPGGNLIAAPSKEAKEVIEDILPHEIAHWFRNNVFPEGEPYKLPKGKQWYTPFWGFGQYKKIDTPQSKREMLHRFKYGW